MKKILLYGLFLVLLITNVLAVDVVISTITADGVQGITTSGSFTMVNNGAADITNIDLSIADLIKGADTLSASVIVLGSTSVDLTAGETKTISFTIAAPAAQVVGAYTGNVVGTYAGGPADGGDLTINVAAPVISLSLPSEVKITGNTYQTLTESFTITNNGNVAAANVQLSVDSSPTYNVQFSNNNILSIATGTSETIDISVDIPETQSSGVTTIGTVTITSGSYTSTFSLKIDIRGRLIIGDLDIKIDNHESNNLKDGELIGEKLKPGSRVEINIKIENEFESSDNMEIENIEIIITLHDIDDGDDIDEELDEFDLDANENSRRGFNFRVPYEVEEGEFILDINVEGTDETGLKHTVDWSLMMQVDKDSHRLKILESEVTPKNVKAGRSASLRMEIYNLGSNDEDDVKITAKNSDLGLDFVDYNVDLENDLTEDESKYFKTVNINVPSSLSSGTYPIEIRAYFNGDDLSDLVTVNLLVKGEEQETDDTIVDNSEEDQDEQQQIDVDEQEQDFETEEESETTITETVESDTPNYVMPLLILNGLLVIGVVILIVFLIKRK